MLVLFVCQTYTCVDESHHLTHGMPSIISTKMSLSLKGIFYIQTQHKNLQFLTLKKYKFYNKKKILNNDKQTNHVSLFEEIVVVRCFISLIL